MRKLLENKFSVFIFAEVSDKLRKLPAGISCSKATMETPEQCVKSAQS